MTAAESQPLAVVSISVLAPPELISGQYTALVKLGLRDGRAIPYSFTRSRRQDVLDSIKAHRSSTLHGAFLITTNPDASKVVRAIITPLPA